MSDNSDSQPGRTQTSAFWAVAILCATVYFLQGISEPTEGLIAQPVRSWLRQDGYGAHFIGWFGAALTVPWVAKPLYGLITDLLPLWGGRRRGYLILTHLVAAIGLFSVYCWRDWLNGPLRAGGLLVWLFIPTVAVAFADVVTDAVMIETGQRWGLAGRLQSIQWAAMYGATIVTGIVGGQLSQYGWQSVGFLISACCAALGMVLAAAFVREPEPAPSMPLGTTPVQAVQRARSTRNWLGRIGPVATFLFLWNFNPFTNSVLYVHITTGLGWSETVYGTTLAWQAAGALVGSLLYGIYCRALSFHQRIHLAIGGGIVCTAAYWVMTDTAAACWISFLVGLAYMTGSLAQMEYAAQVAPGTLPATTFALLMALSNFSLALATGWGGSLYAYWSQAVGATAAFDRLIVVGVVTTAGCWLLMPWFSNKSPWQKADR